MGEKKVRKQNEVVKKIKALFKELEIDIDYFLENLIEKYAKTIEYMDLMEKDIDENGMMYEYTNKAGATNLIKNPLVAEWKAYNREFTNYNKLIVEVIKTYGKGESPDDKLEEFLEEFGD